MPKFKVGDKVKLVVPKTDEDWNRKLPSNLKYPWTGFKKDLVAVGIKDGCQGTVSSGYWDGWFEVKFESPAVEFAIPEGLLELVPAEAKA